MLPRSLLGIRQKRSGNTVMTDIIILIGLFIFLSLSLSLFLPFVLQ